MQHAAQLVLSALSSVVFSLNASTALAQSGAGPAQNVIVRWKQKQVLADSSISAARAMSDAQARFGTSLTPLRTLAIGGEVIRIDRRLSRDELKDLIATLKADPAVEHIEEDLRLQPAFVPNDPQYSQQWHYFEPAGGLNLPAAWDLSTGAGVVVAVLDTGVVRHADLAGNLVGGFDFIWDPFTANDGNRRDADPSDPGDFTAARECGASDDPNDPLNKDRPSSWHGTHVAGTIAAVTHNGSGVAGVAFGAKVVPVRVLGRCGGHVSDFVDAIVWASGGSVPGVPANPHPARVINMSLGLPGRCEESFQTAIDSARSRGAVVVVGAGNGSIDAAGFLPANCSGVIAVAATTRAGGRASYSNFGAVIDVAGPGGLAAPNPTNGVLSTLNSGATRPELDTLAFYQGTSMAAPHVAGTAALMLARNGNLSPDVLEALLKITARPFPTDCNQCGAGIVDAHAAVAAASRRRIVRSIGTPSGVKSQ